MDVRIGYAAWIGQYAGDDAVLVHILVAAGAILFVRTNVPQTLMVRSCHQAISVKNS